MSAAERLARACAAWRSNPCPEAWQEAKAAALDALKEAGRLPLDPRQKSRAVFELLDLNGATPAAVFDVFR